MEQPSHECSAYGNLKLDIHHKAVPIHLEGFLADRFHFQPIKFVGHSQIGPVQPETHHLSATRSPRLLRFLLPFSKPPPLISLDWRPPTLSLSHVVLFRFCERGPVPLSHYRIYGLIGRMRI
ncbi:hypothetical protein AVEN_202467-1 [Araneus ventricosus]|uniref:Uncharacterized protein n=1 Tax=Araneus ventricosus TaxID=182803 RepID=A0A4Y2SHZ9_ARAVE|nr:hypothetical protein AVEN_202467-1 [Araneus ventricosus]